MAAKGKVYRVLRLYDKLIHGEAVHKKRLAWEFGVNEKSIQRDIADVKAFFADRREETGVDNSVIYDKRQGNYHLERSETDGLKNEEILAISKILLDSRAFTRPEMLSVLERLVSCCIPPENRKLVNELLANEKIHYIPPRHGKIFMSKMWEIGKAIHESRYIEISYERLKDKKVVKRMVQPQAIMFSEFYFYMAAYIENRNEEKNSGCKRYLSDHLSNRPHPKINRFG